MATKRKYQPPRGYKDGGRVSADDVVREPTGTNVTVDAATADKPAVDDTLLRAAQAQAAAEAMQRDPIAALPISDFKKNLLRQHPHLLGGFESRALARQYQAALADQVEDDSPEMVERLLTGVQRELHGLHQVATANVMSDAPPIMPQAPQATGAFAPPAPQARPETQARPMPTGANAPQPQRRSVPVQAPPSRSAPSVSGRPSMSNTLTAAEREIARNSFTDRGMSDTEKEYLYLQNREKYRRMKADGSYSTQGE